MMIVPSHLLDARLKDWLKSAEQPLQRYRPRFRDWRFWAVQGLVVLIAAIHDVVEVGGYLPDPGALYFVPISLFFVPVVYAALQFGYVGSTATAFWAVIITIPNWVLWHDGWERFGVIFQMVIVVSLAVFVGQRVDHEMRARRRAEAAGTALRESEMKYRGLFESSPIPILVLDVDGAILDANPAAGVLFGKAAENLKSMAVVDLVGRENEQKLLGSSQKDALQEASLIFTRGNGSVVYLEPTQTQISDSQGNIAKQVLLRDITQERHRQRGLKAYAAYVLRAQEDERQRIARELHDETIQALILLCRRLGAVENTSELLPSSATEELREARRIAEQLVGELRDYAKALRPPALDDLGVVASIRRLIEDFTERTGTRGELKLVGEERRLPRDTEISMFRIAQEALWNVERHSRATEAIVTITHADSEARLDVQDNGVGFNVPPILEEFSARGQLGLLGMQERAELLGGYLEIQSSPGKGTTVTVSYPRRSL